MIQEDKLFCSFTYGDDPDPRYVYVYGDLGWKMNIEYIGPRTILIDNIRWDLMDDEIYGDLKDDIWYSEYGEYILFTWNAVEGMINIYNGVEK